MSFRASRAAVWMASILLALAAPSRPAVAEGHGGGHGHGDDKGHGDKGDKGDKGKPDKPEEHAPQPPQAQARGHEKQEERQAQREAEAQQQRAQAQQQHAQARSAQRAQLPEPARVQERPRVPPPAAAQRRLPPELQQRLIEEQRARTSRYDERLRAQLAAAQQRAQALQQARRLNQYRFQQEYLARLRQQESGLSRLRSYDYGRDPYFYTAPSYRYYRSGQAYDVSRYAADLLRQAVNYGYQEGYRAGQADREDRWRFDYRNSYAYQDALYGYDGLYVNPDDYEYYFREGFQRGYDDGYYSRSQYGVNANGTLGIVASVLSQILNLQALR